ncbi:hypothetical protein A2125_01630 [Candidatus Woesebacteria bacterium GWB1_43_5]|uniref:Uncharacterized protein n=1 Tax=Candidatus Woesebacteria bacterium GWB1_43_5 TaxID=1802474 RepID=A0A1F7WTB5_9BACT|nr:MAG: hypothetical protein A2125_01630 [Candidatus Woesebacteria bacterium GWB1_43_5]
MGDFLIISGDLHRPITWSLPTNYQINIPTTNNLSEKTKDSIASLIPFRNKAGLFGFRNYLDELAVVKYLEIRPNQKKNKEKLIQTTS